MGLTEKEFKACTSYFKMLFEILAYIDISLTYRNQEKKMIKNENFCDCFRIEALKISSRLNV